MTVDLPPANALDAAASRQLTHHFTEFRDNPSLRVAILTGAGERFFCAGWDLNSAAGGEGFEADFGAGGFGGFPELRGLRKPVICAVNGMAVGGGFEMVLAAHLVVAADHAEFFLPETHRGIIPDAASIRLPRLLPRALALETLLGIRRFTAAELADWGLVNRVVPGPEVVAETRRLAASVVESAPLAVEAVLEAMEAGEGRPVDEGLARLREGESYRRMVASDDAAEGPRAFAERRPPLWEGR